MKHFLSEEQVTFVFDPIIITHLIDPAFNMDHPCTPSCDFALEDVLITCLMLRFAFFSLAETNT